MKRSNKIAILGAGSFATALAYLFHFFLRIWMWEYIPERAYQMQYVTRKCRHMENVDLPDNVFVSADIEQVVKDASIICLAIPSSEVEGVMELLRPFLKKHQKLIICSKGFASGQRLLSDAIRAIVPNPIFCLSGPALAGEIVKHKLTKMIIAGRGGRTLMKILQSKFLALRFSEDIIGVQLGGALKNPYTMAVGILEGAGFGENAKSVLIDECLEEVKKIGRKFKALDSTFSGLSFLGDLLLPSGNRRAGIEIGGGKTREDAVANSGRALEGPTTLKNAYEFAKHHHLRVPIIDTAYQVIWEGKEPRQAILELWETLNTQRS